MTVFEALLHQLVLLLKLLRRIARVEITQVMPKLWWLAAMIALVVTVVFENLWPLA